MTSGTSATTAYDRGFARLALWAAMVTLAMIVIGAVTRVTESGMGCGPYWPSCNGHIIPEFVDMTVVIEFGHRLFALVVGVFTVLVGVRAWRRFRDVPMVFIPSMAAVALFFVQSGLGAVTVALYNQWVSVMLHLAVAMLLLAAFLVAWVNARYVAASSPQALIGASGARIVLPPTEVLLATALSFVVAMVGAAVAGTNATRACVGWPLCDGAVWPADQGPLQMLHMLHRLAVGGLGLLLVLMVFQARAGVGTLMRQALFVAGGLFLTQSALGALIVLVDSRELLTAVRAVHVLFAASTWAAMVVVSTVAWLQLLPNVEKKTLPVGASSATTSS
jgi:heme A synthase